MAGQLEVAKRKIEDLIKELVSHIEPSHIGVIDTLITRGRREPRAYGSMRGDVSRQCGGMGSMAGVCRARRASSGRDHGLAAIAAVAIACPPCRHPVPRRWRAEGTPADPRGLSAQTLLLILK